MYEKPIVILEKINDYTKLVSTLKKCFRIHKRISQNQRRAYGTDPYSNKRYEDEQANGLTMLERTRLLEKKRRATMKKLGNPGQDSSEEDKDDDDIKNEYDLDDETAVRLLEETDLKQPFHLNELRLSTFENDVFVDAEPDSVNFVSFHFDKTTLPSVAFTCQSFYDKGGKFLARNTTRMPNLDMISLLYCLIFSPMVEILSNPTKDYYSKIRLENSESSTYSLPFQLTQSDLVDLQELRQTINFILCSENGIKQSNLPNVPKMLTKILYRQRLGINILDKITRMNDDKTLYSHISPVPPIDTPKISHVPPSMKSSQDLDADEEMDKEMEIKEDLDEFDDENEAGYGDEDDEEVAEGEGEKSEENEGEEIKENPFGKKDIAKPVQKVCYFLNDLVYDRLDTDELFEKGDKDEIEQEFNRRFKFRQHIKRELDTRCDLFGLRE